MTSPAVANRQCIKHSGNTRRLGQTTIDPVLEEPGLQLIQMTSVWSKYLTGGVKSHPGSLSRSRNWLLAKTFRSRRSGTSYHHLQNLWKQTIFTKYLTFLQGTKNEFVSNLFFVIGVLMIMVIFGLHAACPRGCIAKWGLYSSRPLPRIQGFRVWLNKSCTWLDCEETLTSCGIS